MLEAVLIAQLTDIDLVGFTDRISFLESGDPLQIVSRLHGA